MALQNVARAAPKLQGVGDVSVGYTDNVQSAPDTPVLGTTPRSPGAFLMLNPGVVLADATERAIQRVKYTFTYDLFFEKTSVSTSSNRLEYNGFFDLSPRTSLLVGAAAVQSNYYSSIVLTAPAAGTVNALPAGSGSFLTASANEILSFDLGPGWRGYEGAVVSEATPLFDTVAPRTFEPAGRAGIERSFVTDAAGVEGRVDFSDIQGSVTTTGAPEGVQPQIVAAGVQRQIIAAGVALWRHDWGRAFTSRAEAGALRVERLNTGRGAWEPTGTAELAYVEEFGDAELSYSHTVATNLLLGQTFLIDQVQLRGAIPITKKGEVSVASSAGYQSGRILDEDLAPAAHVKAILADVGVGWQTTPALLLAIRYQHFQQISDRQIPPLPLSFVRNTVLVGATFRFPPESEMPRAYRAPRRVDRADEIREVVEPEPGVAPGHPGGPGT